LDLEGLHASLVLLFSFLILNFNSAEAVVFRSSTPSLGHLLNLCDYKSPAKLFVFSCFFLKSLGASTITGRCTSALWFEVS